MHQCLKKTDKTVLNLKCEDETSQLILTLYICSKQNELHVVLKSTSDTVYIWSYAGMKFISTMQDIKMLKLHVLVDCEMNEMTNERGKSTTDTG